VSSHPQQILTSGGSNVGSVLATLRAAARQMKKGSDIEVPLCEEGIMSDGLAVGLGAEHRWFERVTLWNRWRTPVRRRAGIDDRARR